jgi:hypothetical protein
MIEEALHYVLIHADCRSEHAGPDKRNVEEAQKSLETTILPEGPMDKRKHNVGALIERT